MKRILTVLLAAAATLVAAAAAQASSIHAHRVAQSAAAVRAYWTAARMQAAVPADRVAKGSGNKGSKRPGTSAYPYTSAEVTTPYTDSPTSAHGKVFFTERGTNYVCSGTAVASGNRSVVWTAGHCVNEGPGAYVTNWAFVPAYRDGVRPFGTWAARALLTTDAWRTAGDFSYDLGAAVVSAGGDGSGRVLDDVVATRGARFNYDPASFTFVSYGYPAAAPFNGQRLWTCTAPLGTRDASASPATMGIGCNMTGGSSGGGWVVGNDVVSVNSYGYNTQKNVMYGPYQGTVAQSLYATAGSS